MKYVKMEIGNWKFSVLNIVGLRMNDEYDKYSNSSVYYKHMKF